MTIIIAFVLGLLAGVIPKGIHIHVHKPVETVDKPKEYNPSLSHLLPPEVKNYYHSTQGKNQF
jgi:hypothetical protein